MRWVVGAIAFVLVTVLVAAHLGRPRAVQITAASEIGEAGERGDLDIARIRADIERLSSARSRMTGSAGAESAKQAILDELTAMGVTDVQALEFGTPVPVTDECFLEVTTAAGAERVPLHPVWPNLARTCQTPPDGLSGPLVAVGRGTEDELAGKTIRDSIVVMDWASNLEWQSVPEFGGKAVVFRANDDATCYTARNKFLSVPADIPRFYVAREDAATLDRLAALRGPAARLVCRSSWRKVEGTNILARVSKGTADASADAVDMAPVVFHAYYDSVSTVPDLAPGAEQACGTATLLELGRFLGRAPGKRPVYLLFTSGHGQAFAGMLDFVSRLRQSLEEEKGDSLLAQMGTPGLFVGLDLSSRSESFGIFALGRFRGQYEGRIRPVFSVLGSQLADFADGLCRTEERKDGRTGDETAEEEGQSQFIDCINLTRGRNWWTYFPYGAAFESEIPTMGGIPAVTLATVNDDRRYVDTPGDRFERLRLDLFEKQITSCQGTRPGLASLAQAFTEWSGPFVSRALTDAWATLEGRVVWLDQERNYVPSEPLEEAVVFLKTQRGDKHLMGTRGIPAVMTNAEGRFRFDGLIQVTENWQFRNCALEAYGMATEDFTSANPEAMAQFRSTLERGGKVELSTEMDGGILYALDMARASDYPWRIEIRKPIQHLNLVCFPCRALTLTGLTDPRGYLPLKDLKILEAATLAPPFQFGQSATDSMQGDDTESFVTLWADPTIRVMLTLGHGFEEKRLVLINNTEQDSEGRGFVIEDLQTVPSMVLQGARDMWNLDETRINKLETNGVRNPRLKQFHKEAGEHLRVAESALASCDYRTYRSSAEKAWALEGKAYAEVLRLINNMIRGVLFYLALLLPFSYCLERLLLASGTIKRRVIWISVIFSICFLVLAAAHPAFRFTMTPFLVLLAFIIVALVLTVSVLIVTRMDTVLQEQKRTRIGRHEEQQNVGGITVRAIDLGISNIRRRPQRGILTALTVITVTFILLSFISLTPVVSISRLTHPDGVPTYPGLLVRDRAWQPLPNPLHGSIQRNMQEAPDGSKKGWVASARSWFFSDSSGKLSQIDVSPVGAAADEDNVFTAVALLCMEHTEPQITDVGQTLVAGRWFESEDELGAILPQHVAEMLWGEDGVESRVGEKVRIFGQDIPVVGIIDQARFDEIRDIDGEPLTPVNFVLQQQMQAEGASEDAEESDTLQEYIHYSSDKVVILPFRFGHRLGATIRSIAVKGGSVEELDEEAQGYTKRSNLTILSCDGERVTLYAALNTSQISAAWQIVVPLFLGFIMVLATMLGSVYERQNEIFVYNSVGLSPGSVASLFLAESSVYAFLGAGMGYLIGQVASRVLQMTGWLSGLTLNYTAGSTVLVTLMTMAMVLFSTLYPASRAFKAAVPDVEREDESSLVGDASTDAARFFLPFVATPVNVFAMQAYMMEFLRSIHGVTVGQMAVDNLGVRTEIKDGRRIPVLLFRAWLAPFDLGTSHDVELRIAYREDRDVYQYHLTAVRFSGDHQNWQRLMPRFVLSLRKQILMWRVLTPSEIRKYQEDGERLFETA